MKKNLLSAIACGTALLGFATIQSQANVLIEDFEKDDNVSLLGDKDVWFVYSDSADAGCQTFFDYDYEENVTYESYFGEGNRCSYFSTLYLFDGVPDTWYNDPTTFVNYETGEDTTMSFPLRTDSPYTSKDSAKGEVGVRQYLTTNNTKVGGIFYEFGDSQLMMRPTPTGYNIAEPDYWFLPYVAIGLKTEGNGVTYDLSKCTGISYKYRGEGHRFRADMSTIGDYNYHYATLSASKTMQGVINSKVYQGWSTATIRWSSLKQENWGIKKAFDATKVTQLVWELKGGNESYCDYEYCSTSSTSLFEKKIVGVSNSFGDLAIDDVTCLTNDSEIPVGPRSSSSAVKPSSSSKKTDGFAALNSIKFVQVVENGISLQTTSATSVDFFDCLGRSVHSVANLSAGANFVSFEGLTKGGYIAVIRTNDSAHSLQIQVK